MSALAAMHVAKRDLGLDEDDYCAVLERVTGLRSAKAMTPAQQQACVAEFKRLGFGAATSSRPALSGPYVAKLRALWLSAWHLGVARNRDDRALIDFVTRQTGLQALSWVRDQRDAARAIEGLKAWIAREGGVIWPKDRSDVRGSKLAVIAAQHTKLGFEGRYRDVGLHDRDLDQVIAGLGAQIRKLHT
jgi:hypothetical protein